MISNVQSLKDNARNFAKENNLSVQQVLQNYMFEKFLERLSVSKYKEKLIIKGGLLLSSIIGINLRTTMDIDVDIIGINFEQREIEKVITEIINIRLEDNVKIILEKIEEIKEENEYGGFRFKLIGNLINLRIPFHIDISTGDIITPKAIEYRYKKILENDYIEIYTYNQESIIAEKLQTVLSRKVANSRMKDYYDLYFFTNFKWQEINKEILKQAIKATFQKRNSIKDLEEIEKIINILEKDETLIFLWNDYKGKYDYSKNIKYNDIISALRFISNEIS